MSHSYSVLASAADSIVDIASQAVLALADWQVGKVDPRYPVGKTRLQTVAVIACAVIMSFATLAVIQESGKSLYSGLRTGELYSQHEPHAPCALLVSDATKVVHLLLTACGPNRIMLS